MRRSIAVFCLLSILSIASGCAREQPAAPSPQTPAAGQLAIADTAPLDCGSSSALFYTPYWPAPDWLPSLEVISTRTGLGTHLVTLDLSQIAVPPGLPVFTTPYGVTFDVDGTMYSIVTWFDGVQQDSGAQLARFDMSTGVATPIGEPYSINFAGPEFDHCGNLYATGFTVGPPEDPSTIIVWGNSLLYRIDKYTGVATPIGDTGRTDWMDLAFDAHGQLWATTDNMLYLLDTETGASTFVTDIHGVPNHDMPGVDPADWPWMEVMSIDFDEHGTLWATAMKGFSAASYSNAPFMSIDVETGMATLVGYTGKDYNHGGDIMPTTVRICHRMDHGRFKPMTIPLQALPAHRAHGDIVPGTAGHGCQCPGDDVRPHERG